MLSFVDRRQRPALSTLSLEDLKGFKTADEVVLVLYADDKDHAARELVADIAPLYRNELSFAWVGERGEEVGEWPVVACYRMLDGDVAHFRGFDQEKRDELDKWIGEASRGVVGELTALNRDRLIKRGWPMVYLFGETESQRVELRKVVYKFARSYYDSLTVVVVDPFAFPGLMEKLGLETGRFPAGAVHQVSKDRIYHWPRDLALTPASLQQWGLDVYQGRIKPWTPPGVTTSYDDLGPTRVATGRISIASGIPGVKIKVAGHDEL
ncbi:hypothetical protein OQA88_493 [Cercophora sp. LCS_1]